MPARANQNFFLFVAMASFVGALVNAFSGRRRWMRDGIFVTATVKNAFRLKGARKFVYQSASSLCAQYVSDEKTESIYYEGSDLQVRLLFKTSLLAGNFENSLDTLQERVGGEEADNVIESKLEYKVFEEILDRQVRANHHVSDDTESPTVTSRSREEHSGVVVAPYADLVQFQSIEAPGSLHLGHHKCHIKSSGECDDFEDKDDNNFLAMTPTVHHLFDAYLNSPTSIPSIRLSVLDVAEQPTTVFSLENNVQQQRYRVDVLVECANIYAYQYGIAVKEFSENDPDSLTKKTYVMVKDPAAFSQYISWKHKNTTDRGFQVSI